MKVKNLVLLFAITQLHSFSACEVSSATEVLSTVAWRHFPARARHPCWGTPAGAGEEVCIVRSNSYSKTMFQHVSGCYCYFYMNPAFFKPNITIRMWLCGIPDEFEYPCIRTPEGVEIPYDYENPKTVEVLGGTFVTSAATDKWIQCSKAAKSCCDNMYEETAHPGQGYCSANWDGWSCWDKAPVETTQHGPCPDYIYFAEPPSCQQYSNKECFATGGWNESTDYAPCSSLPILLLRNRTSYHVILLYVSIATSLPALIIFFSYRKLRITRVTLHRNLIVAIVLRNVISILVKTIIILDAISNEREGVMETNSVWCRVLSFMDKLAGSAVYSCMLLESVFLHRLIAAAFKGEPRMLCYYCVAIGLAILPVAIWATITALYNDVNCWAADSTNYGYIVDGPRILTLVINALLMLDIVRVLWTKLRRVNTAKSQHIKRMTRATILLMPLFGVQFLLTLVRPSTKDCDLEQAYYYIFYTMDSLQCTLVALFYCYLNKEVHVQILRSYNTLMTHLYRLLGKDYEPKRRPTWVFSERRQTSTSLVIPDDVARTSVTSPPSAVGRKESHLRSSRTSLVVGSVSDILAQQDAAQSPGTLPPRRSVSFARSSSSNHYIPNRLHVMNSARQRKVSVVNEESQAEDERIQEQRPTAVTSISHSKSHDSDEEIQGSNREPYPGYMDNSEELAIEVTGSQILLAPTGQNLGLSEYIAVIAATDMHADSGTGADGQSCA